MFTKLAAASAARSTTTTKFSAAAVLVVHCALLTHIHRYWKHAPHYSAKKGDPNGSTSKRLLAVVRIVTEGNCSCVSYRCLHSSTLLLREPAISIQNIQRRMVERGAAFTFIRDALMCPQKQQLLTTHCFPPLPFSSFSDPLFLIIRSYAKKLYSFWMHFFLNSTFIIIREIKKFSTTRLIVHQKKESCLQLKLLPFHPMRQMHAYEDIAKLMW